MSPRSFSDIVTEDRRLVILRILEESAGYESNNSMVSILAREVGHAEASGDLIRTDFAWLQEQGMVTLEEIVNVQIAKLTQRGLETAQGIITTPGVKRPSPQ